MNFTFVVKLCVGGASEKVEVYRKPVLNLVIWLRDKVGSKAVCECVFTTVEAGERLRLLQYRDAILGGEEGLHNNKLRLAKQDSNRRKLKFYAHCSFYRSSIASL